MNSSREVPRLIHVQPYYCRGGGKSLRNWAGAQVQSVRLVAVLASILGGAQQFADPLGFGPDARPPDRVAVRNGGSEQGNPNRKREINECGSEFGHGNHQSRFHSIPNSVKPRSPLFFRCQMLVNITSFRRQSRTSERHDNPPDSTGSGRPTPPAFGRSAPTGPSADRRIFSAPRPSAFAPNGRYRPAGRCPLARPARGADRLAE